LLRFPNSISSIITGTVGNILQIILQYAQVLVAKNLSFSTGVKLCPQFRALRATCPKYYVEKYQSNWLIFLRKFRMLLCGLNNVTK